MSKVKMPFYESLHCGIMRISLNEQYIWKWLSENEKISSVDVRVFTLLVEDALHLHDYEKGSLDLQFLISEVYKAYAGKKQD